MLNYGRFQLSTVGMQALANIGELWVTYKVTFSCPRLPESGAGAVTQTYSTQEANYAIGSGATTELNLFVEQPNDNPKNPAVGMPWIPCDYLSTAPYGVPIIVPKTAGTSGPAYVNFTHCPVGSCWRFDLAVKSDKFTPPSACTVVFPNPSQPSENGPLFTVFHGVATVPYFRQNNYYRNHISTIRSGALIYSCVVQVQPPNTGNAVPSFADLNYLKFDNFGGTEDDFSATLVVTEVPFTPNWRVPVTAVSQDALQIDSIRSQLRANQPENNKQIEPVDDEKEYSLEASVHLARGEATALQTALAKMGLK